MDHPVSFVLFLYKEKASRPVQAHSKFETALNKFIRYQHLKMENWNPFAS